MLIDEGEALKLSIEESTAALKVEAPPNLHLSIEDDASHRLNIDSLKAYEVGLDMNVVIGGGTPYSGSYTVTPTQYAQTLNTAGKTLQRNITVEPIPSNYGLITWNGATLTVS